MKTYLSLLALLCLGFYASAQSTQTIRGVILDSLKKQPMGYVTVALRHTKTNLPVKSMLSKDNGSFEFTGLPMKSYQLVLASVGFKNKVIDIDSTKKVINLGEIQLAASTSSLNEVSVTAVRPIVKQEVDRIAYDVQADPSNKVETALDMMRKVPLVSVDASDNIKLKGNTDYKILINGKPSSLVARNPSDVLKAMPASNIEKIEVITTPPAKYEAEGLAGIINIITKKNADQGYNGSWTTRYNTVWGLGSNLNATVKQGKFGLNGYIGFNRQNKQTTQFGNTTNTFIPVVSSLQQTGTNYRDGGRNNYGSAELSYEIDTLNLLTGNIESYTYKFNQRSEQNTGQYDGDDVIQQGYRLANASSGNYHGTDLGLNYQLGFKHNKEQLLTMSYKYSSNGSTQDAANIFTERFNYGLPNYNQYNNSGTREHTVQVDYVQPVKKVTIEAGGKAILRKNFSDFTSDTLNTITNQYVNNTLQTNNFDYQQNVYSGYNSYQVKWTKWTLKGGLRLEHTNVDAHFTSIGSVATQDYNNLIPSVSIQRQLKSSSINFGFSNRISRPNIWQLNPFIDASNPKYINVGNPALRPVVNHSFELNYSNFAKGSITGGISYSYANNTIQSVTTIRPDTVSVTTYQNVGQNKRLGANLNVNYPITKKLNLNINSQLVYVWLKGTANNIFYSNKGIQGYIFGNAGYKFEKGWRVGVDGGVDSRYVLLQGKDNYWAGGSLSASKDFLKEKANIGIYVSNPWKKFRTNDSYNRTNEFEQTNFNQNYYRNIGFSFTYKFGRLNSQIKKNQRGIENDDSSGNRGGNH
ncbi:TonB-dependent receptor domain-containing protein [Mucilaginibacter jinjuensis]|uniref:TonB-dependent receptor n=1 Tax=Mucilaginibacter jinjuensis TaxID=1176721 RepID=A0ABY7T924_9SPHI|nr:TonB-dependent receptor [Mucilaginibacter jinjuensis]WCT12990.1 TonB-dependent receptor [Mucilaginibacter jinjuensis]